MTKMEKNYWKAFVWTLLAYIALGAFTYLAPILFDDLIWADSFNRAGAIMVVFGIIAEGYIFIAWGGHMPLGRYEPDDIPYDEESHLKKVSRLRLFTNLTILLGTIIWAYGDLIWKSVTTFLP